MTPGSKGAWEEDVRGGFDPKGLEGDAGSPMNPEEDKAYVGQNPYARPLLSLEDRKITVTQQSPELASEGSSGIQRPEA
ncbi:MAG: hypothetical protein B9J98_05770 [Candidatus Terraquivivens tikiterensis]|uniref:Uncharacterized protein n=1 Tax=Candidatus Terraquivivens tikiterensis TaxID=1980982 RepID=A0A2R7Y259_9ARCH|nr:MAG: hypothetical protein B9J98_05770 [Candidatus Terraquivivens tikiterensis]